MSTTDHDGNIACLERPDCAQMFFVYAGKQGMVEGMGPMTFLQKCGITDRNIVFVRDPHQCFFERGVSADIPSMDALLDWHSEYIASHPHVTEVYSIGNSFGGWASLFFGYMMGMTKTWALAPGGPWGRKLLVDLMLESNGITEYDIYYSRKLPEDQLFAESLDGYPGVKLVHIEEYGHDMISGLLLNNQLPDLFPAYKAVE